MSAERGLVSVPTTHTRLLVDSSELRANLGAFEVDTDKRRLAMLRMSVGFAARAHAVSAKGHRSDVPWLVTLTYRGVMDWRPDHIRSALTSARNWATRRGFAFRYVWVAELQKRGAIHYHVCVWLPRGVRMPKWDSDRAWWPHGMANRKVARHATAYLMKYLSKGTDYGRLPPGARAYGVGGLDHSLRRARRWLRLPSFVQGNSSIHDKWERVVGGGWRAPSGDHHASEFRLVVAAGARCLLRVAEHARSIVAGGPFSWLTDRSRACVAPC